MNRPALYSIVASLTFVVGISTYALLRNPHARVTSGTEAAAINVTDRFYEAVERHDTKTLDGIIADDCVLTFNRNFLVGYEPFSINKAEVIANFTDSGHYYQTSVVNSTAREDQTSVTVSGDLLLITEKWSDDLSYHFKHTYTNRQGRLQLASAELTMQEWPKG